jgi:hypothetical protein
MSARCVICTVRPPRLTEGRRRACEVCRGQLYAMLSELATLASFLRHLLEPGRVLSDSPTRTKGEAAPAPVRVDVLALLADSGDLSISQVLAPYVADTIKGRRLSGDVTGPELLRRHADWCTEQVWLEEMAADVRRLYLAVRAACGESTTVIKKHEGCGGSIVASTWTDEATCGGCGASWPRTQWRELGARQREEQRV